MAGRAGRHAGCRVPESGIAGVFSLPDAELPDSGND
jgi:hypothetical protein